MIGRARVELHAAFPEAAGLDLDPDDVAVRWDHRSEVEGESLAKRKQDGQVGGRQLSEDGGLC